MPVSEAIQFVCETFFDPLIKHPDVDPKAVNIAKNFRTWARSLENIGDLFDFLTFLEASPDTTVYSSQRKLNLPTISETVKAFEARFRAELDDRLTPKNLRIGGTYSPYVIHAMCGSYDLRSGGILPVKDEGGAHAYTAIKATLNGGVYQNVWLDEGRRLKYFMKAIQGNFKETYQDNAAIIDNPQCPVFVFSRDAAREAFTYFGRFFMLAIHTESNGDKWFELAQWSEGQRLIEAATSVNESLATMVQKSLELDTATRRSRISESPEKPAKRRAMTTVFDRSPHVIAEVLIRANGLCEGCGSTAPFERKSNGTPYLEVHHKVPLAKDGADTIENAIALCPNCHRREHYGSAIWPH